MEYDQDKIDEIVLALLHLTSSKEGDVNRTWKSYDWSVLDRLHEKGFISNPKTKAKSIVISDSGAEEGEKLVSKYFSKAG